MPGLHPGACAGIASASLSKHCAFSSLLTTTDPSNTWLSGGRLRDACIVVLPFQKWIISDVPSSSFPPPKGLLLQHGSRERVREVGRGGEGGGGNSGKGGGFCC